MPEVRLMDMNNILRNYGFKEGCFYLDINTPDNKLPFIVRAQFGAIEKDACIDTAEEFVTAAYYSPISISPKAQAAIDKELPKDSEGAKRLGAMWMRKIAEYPENSANYNKAIDLICSKSNVTRTEITAYYAIAIEKLIFETGKKHLGGLYSQKELKDGGLKPIVDYYLNPTEDNLNKIALTAKESRDRKKYFDVLVNLNEPLSTRVIGALLRL